MRAGEGVIRWIVDNGRPMTLDDTQAPGAPLAAHRHSFIGVPMLNNNDVVGVLYALDYQNRTYRAADVDFLLSLARRAAAAIVQIQRLDRERRQRQLAETLQGVGVVLSSTHTLEPLLANALSALGDVVAYDGAFMALFNEDRTVLSIGQGTYDDSRLKQIVSDKLPALVSDNDNAGSLLSLADELKSPAGQSWICTPLVHHSRTMGLLVVESCQAAAYDAQDRSMVEAFGSQAAIAIDNARLYEQTRAALHTTDALYRATRSLIASSKMDDVLRAVIEGTRTALNADLVTILRVDMEKRSVDTYMRVGEGVQALDELSFDEMWDGLSGWAIRHRAIALSPKGVLDARESPYVQARRQATGAGSILVTPLCTHN